MTKHPDIFAALAAPFDPSEVKARSIAGRQLHYVTARTVMNRLDDVLGPENWWDDYLPNANSVLCRITVLLPDGRALTKADAGGYAGMEDSGDDDKSGYSDAFKRAAVKFGVARYLYRDGVPAYVSAPEPDQAPRDLGWVHNADAPRAAAAPAPAPGPNRVNGRAHDGPPRTGKALFAWVKDREQEYEVGLLKYLNGWAKLQDFPGRMVDWDAAQVALAHAEASRKLAAAVGAGV